MNRKVYFVFLVFVITLNLFSIDFRTIELHYSHSMRIPYNQIHITLMNTDEHGVIKVVTSCRPETVGFEDSNREFTIDIEKAYLDDLYFQILELDFSSIIENNTGNPGLDGVSITIQIGDFQNNLSLTIWSPDINSSRRQTDQLYMIIEDIFEKSTLSEWL